jgi:class 3 adenylate cyclase/tetratricopeptide (TPR) repeat protein
LAISRHAADESHAGEEAWRAASTYLAPDLIRGLKRHAPTEHSWIEPLDGTLVMADISGFTKMSERLAEIGKEGAEWLTNTINLYFESMLDSARRFGGSNLKFGGDALLLSFAGPGHAERAVRSALAMQAANRRFAAVRLEKDRIRLKMSIGVHSGRFWSAVAGLPGHRMQHLVFGADACRVAAAEGVAEAGEVVVTTETLAQIEDARMAEKDGFFRVLGLPRSGGQAEESSIDTFQHPNVLWYLPPPVATALQTPEQAEIAAGEHRRTTVIFLHLTGLEGILASSGPQAVLAELQSYVSLVAELTQRHGGFLAGSDIYNEGLKLILVFGAPVAREQDAANALRLALELKERLPDMGLRLNHRMGVNTGFVFAGDIGTEYRREYTVMGDAVNLAARLMSAAPTGEILASQRTIDEAGYGFEVRALDPIRVKGKSQPIPIASVEGETQAAPALEAERAGELVGREAELEELRAICVEVEDGRSRTVAIVGEAGIGKSRLTADFLDYLGMRGWNVHRGQCQSHLAGNPFSPWTQIVSALLDLDLASGTAGRAQTVQDAVAAMAPEMAEMSPLLSAIVPVQISETEATQGLDEEARRRLLFDLVTELIKGASKERQVALVMEDLHWADSSSLQLLSHVTGAITTDRVLLLSTARKLDGVDLSPAGERLRLMELSELPAEGALQLVRSVLGMPSLHPRIAETLMAKARGNPLFLAEVARSLRESGELDRLASLPESQLAAELETLDIPDRVQSLIMSRIDSLSTVARETLRGASVIGTSFDEATVKAVLEPDIAGGGLERSVGELVRAQMIEPESDGWYRFGHALIQDVAYDSLLYSRRRKLHQRAGSYIEVLHWQDPTPVYETLVYHYLRGANKPRALLYSVRAGDKARQVFANDEAIEHYERASGLAPGIDTVRIDGARPGEVIPGNIEAALADILELTGEHQAAVRSYGRALMLLAPGLGRVPVTAHRPVPEGFRGRARKRDPQTRRIIANICRKVGSVHERLSDYETAQDWFRAGLSVLPRNSDTERARGCIGVSGAYFRAGDYSNARSWCLRGLRAARKADARPELAHAYDLLGVIYRDAGSASKAIAQRRHALAIYEELNDLTGQGDTLNNLGLDYFSLGGWVSAVHRFSECLEMARRTGDLDLQAIAHNNLGEVYLAQGDVERAKAEFRWTIDARQRLGHIAIGALAEANLGQALLLEGRMEEARSALQSSLQDFRKIKARAFEAEVNVRLAGLLVAEDKPDQASAVARRALNTARTLQLAPVEENASILLGRLAFKRRRWSEAEARLTEALQLARKSRGLYGEARALAGLGAFYSARQKDGRDKDRSRECLREAEAIFQRLGADLDLRAAQTELQSLSNVR